MISPRPMVPAAAAQETLRIVTLQVLVPKAEESGRWAVGFTRADQTIEVCSGTVDVKSTYDQTRAETMVAAVAAVIQNPGLAGPVALDIVDSHLRVRIGAFLKSAPNLCLSIRAGTPEQRSAVEAALGVPVPEAPPVQQATPLPWVLATDASIKSTGTVAGLGWVVALANSEKVRTCGNGIKLVRTPGDILSGELAAIREGLRAARGFKGGLTALSDSQAALDLIRRVQDGGRFPLVYTGYHLQEAKDIVKLASGTGARFKWVKGHQGNLLNEAADRLAVMARRNVEFGVSDKIQRKMLGGVRQELLTGSAA